MPARVDPADRRSFGPVAGMTPCRSAAIRLPASGRAEHRKRPPPAKGDGPILHSLDAKKRLTCLQPELLQQPERQRQRPEQRRLQQEQQRRLQRRQQQEPSRQPERLQQQEPFRRSEQLRWFLRQASSKLREPDRKPERATEQSSSFGNTPLEQILGCSGRTQDAPPPGQPLRFIGSPMPVQWL